MLNININSTLYHATMALSYPETRKLRAIKALRYLTGASLKDAKDAIDNLHTMTLGQFADRVRGDDGKLQQEVDSRDETIRLLEKVVKVQDQLIQALTRA